ncbi:GNAT family N-acetyltransferase [Priestia megaterium]|uniref:GNAT family N-acetyltransferase n=1 Tax=Priestia megaterium TaxID=1404 RepID=UPI0006FA0800|nr:GNAT family protein [Priestia megaterium]KQU21636.1 GNAT family acetyltransferase [Bacillus sp. Leaf75]USL45644.1 GNAT family N-acetyltransferase [Priestia megaterium]
MELIGQRAKLRLMNMGDIEVLYNLVQRNPNLWKYMVRKMDSLGDMENLVIEALKNFDKETELPFVVIDRVSNTIVGSTRLYDISLDRQTVEVGSTFYDKSVQKTSINTECKFLLLKHSFEHLNMVRVQIKTDIQNIGAQRAIERIGGVKEGILRNERMLHNGRIRDAVLYSITNNEWNVVKVKLEDLLTKRYDKVK